FDETVDPSEAKRLTNGVFVADRLYPCVGLVEQEPDPWTRRVMLCQPRPPLSATPNLQRHEFCRHADWPPLRLSTVNSALPATEREELGCCDSGFMNDQWLLAASEPP